MTMSASPIPLDIILQSMAGWVQRLDAAVAAQDWKAVNHLRCDICSAQRALHHAAHNTEPPPHPCRTST
jgi:hypothetical protein